jgi:hypothetical protein
MGRHGSGEDFLAESERAGIAAAPDHSQALPSPSLSSPGLYPGSPRRNGATPAARAAAQLG